MGRRPSFPGHNTCRVRVKREGRFSSTRLSKTCCNIKIISKTRYISNRPSAYCVMDFKLSTTQEFSVSVYNSHITMNRLTQHCDPRHLGGDRVKLMRSLTLVIPIVFFRHGHQTQLARISRQAAILGLLRKNKTKRCDIVKLQWDKPAGTVAQQLRNQYTCCRIAKLSSQVISLGKCCRALVFGILLLLWTINVTSHQLSPHDEGQQHVFHWLGYVIVVVASHSKSTLPGRGL